VGAGGWLLLLLLLLPGLHQVLVSLLRSQLLVLD
jgi:hypothetical protein